MIFLGFPRQVMASHLRVRRELELELELELSVGNDNDYRSQSCLCRPRCFQVTPRCMSVCLEAVHAS